MPSFQWNKALAATTNFQPLVGWQYEYLPFPAAVTVLTTSDQIDTTLQVTSGSETIQERSVVTKGTINVVPNQFTCAPIRWVGAAGDRLKLDFNTVTAGTVSGIITISPLR